MKRVVELSAELTSVSSSISIDERRIHQLETELKRRGVETNQLKATIKRDDEGVVKMKQQIAALTNQVTDCQSQWPCCLHLYPEHYYLDRTNFMFLFII